MSGVEYAWLGLTCINNLTSSCTWDNGIPMTSTSYNNFVAGHPAVVESGPCVLMLVKTGMWYSADCSNTYANWGCKYTPGVSVAYCNDYGYTEFRGKCYYVTTFSTRSEGDDPLNQCAFYDALPLSIHSAGDNYYVKGLAGYHEASQVFLRVLPNSTWYDGSPMDYTNYGYLNTQLGNCVAMSINNDLVPGGKWISETCMPEDDGISICRRDPIEPTPPPTMSPPQCTATQFLSGYGTIYSPAYPLGSPPNHCEYLITENEGTNVQITLKNLQLDKNSVLQLYSTLFSERPFENLTNINSTFDRTYQSPTSTLKIVYDTAGSENSQNVWTGDYSGWIPAPTVLPSPTVPPFRCGPYYYNNSGTVNSENYPGSYPDRGLNCTYVLQTYSSSTCFTFDAFDIRDYDYIYLYDGDPINGLVVAVFTASSPPGNGVYCTSAYNVMWIVLGTYDISGQQVTGWKGRFAADSSELLATTPYPI